MKLEYFGTNLTEHGHYHWDLSSSHNNYMVKVGLIPKNTPFNPEELTRGMYKGGVAYYKGGGYTAIAISGSPKDERPGSKSVFWVDQEITKEALLNVIMSNKLGYLIITNMPFEIRDTMAWFAKPEAIDRKGS